MARREGLQAVPLSGRLAYQFSSTSHRWIMKDNVLFIDGCCCRPSTSYIIELSSAARKGAGRFAAKSEKLARFIVTGPIQGRKVRGLKVHNSVTRWEMMDDRRSSCQRLTLPSRSTIKRCWTICGRNKNAVSMCGQEVAAPACLSLYASVPWSHLYSRSPASGS